VTGDSITAERKFKDPFTFRPHTTLCFSCNKLPRSRDKTYGFYKRLIIIPFERTFTGDEQDPVLREQLIRPEELSGILNRALSGLYRLFTNKEFTVPQRVQALIDDYKTYNDSVKEFLTECTNIDPDSSMTKQEFRDAYSKWCKQNGHRPEGQNEIKKSVLAFSTEIKEGRPNGGSRSWTGLRLNDETPE
jgi:putative DNA primase/helicase